MKKLDVLEISINRNSKNANSKSQTRTTGNSRSQIYTMRSKPVNREECGTTNSNFTNSPTTITSKKTINWLLREGFYKAKLRSKLNFTKISGLCSPTRILLLSWRPTSKRKNMTTILTNNYFFEFYIPLSILHKQKSFPNNFVTNIYRQQS